jgi:GTPase SAR1 family protein
MTAGFFKPANGIIVVFDLTDPNSFVCLKDWIRNIEDVVMPGSIKALVGNKADLKKERRVSDDDINQIAKLYKMRYFETSAKSNTNIDELFGYMMEKMYKQMNEDSHMR